MIVCITTCKGRLAHLKQTLPKFVENFPLTVVVDYDCPDKTCEWSSAVRNTLTVHVREAPIFHKTKALNLGAQAAMRAGATRLVFMDADTIIEKPFSLNLKSNEIALTGPKNKIECDRNTIINNLCGFLSCSVESFQTAKGYDETFIGWGYQDLSMRLRLLSIGCKPIWLNNSHFSSIKHDNKLRTQFQKGNWALSNRANRKKYNFAVRDSGIKITPEVKGILLL